MSAAVHARILLVDDQPANLAVPGAILDGLADSLVAAESGEAARRALLEHEFALVPVVDDNVDAAESQGAVLGHETRIAHDGAAGLQAAREFRPDLAFLDIGLPGMNGHELARALRADPHVHGVVLVALTGWGAAGDMTQSHEAGFDQHLTKPAGLEALAQALAAATQGPA